MRLLAAMIGLCIVLAMSTAAFAAPNAAANAQLVVRAERLLKRGRTAQAILLLRRVQERAPTLATTLTLARLLLPDPRASHARDLPPAKDATLREQANEIIRWVDALPLVAQPEERDVLREIWRVRAWAQAWSGDFAGALGSLRERGQRGDLETARMLQSVAALAVEREDLHSAEAALSVAARFTPEDLTLRSGLAAVLLAQGRAEDAIPWWEALLQQDDSALDVRRDLAAAYLAAGRGAHAWKLLEAQSEACDAAENCALEAARAALEIGEPAAAVARLAGTFEADAIETQFLLADAHTRLGAWARAREAYVRILAQKPGNVRARENLRALEVQVQESGAN